MNTPNEKPEGTPAPGVDPVFDLITTVQPLLVINEKREVTTPAEVEKAIEELLKDAETVQNVSGVKSNEIAVAVVGKIRGTLKVIEETRVKLKDPFLKMGRAIDAKASKVSAALVVQDLRLTGPNGLVTQFQREELRKKRLAEEEQAKALRQIEETKTPQAAAAVPIPCVPKAAVKAEGQSLGTKWTYEVLDIAATFKAKPELCKPLEISPSAMNVAIAGGLRECPGLRIFEDVKQSFRAT